MERSNFRINRIYSYEEAFNEVDRLNRAFETFLDNYLTLLDRLRITPYVKNDDEYIQYLKVMLKKKYIDEYEHKMIKKTIYRAFYYRDEYKDVYDDYSIEETNEILLAAEFVLNEGMNIVNRKLEEFDSNKYDA